jgi:hypothetical protein
VAPSAADSGGNDPSFDPTGRQGPVGVDDRKHDPVDASDRDDPALTVVLANIDPLERARHEDTCGELEIEAPPDEVLLALAGVPAEAPRT